VGCRKASPGSQRIGLGPDAGGDVNFEWPLWLELSTPSLTLPKLPGSLCMTSSPNYAPPYPCESELSQSAIPSTSPLKLYREAKPPPPLHPTLFHLSLSLLSPFSYDQSPPFCFLFNPQKGIV